MHILIPDGEVSFTFARSGGKGGQNVNKVNSKAILDFNIAASRSLTDEQKTFVRAHSSYRTADGHLIIHCDESRSQADNRRIALRRLNDHLTRLLTPREERVPTKPTRASRIKRVESKRRHSEQKRRRRIVDY